MTHYRVEWAIDIEADTPEEAARLAKWYQANGDWCSVFSVIDENGDSQDIDLDERNLTPLHPAKSRL